MNPTDENAPLHGSRVLIVEDEPIVALDLAMTVEDEGARVEGPICRLEQAMERDGLSRLDAAIVDVDIAGREVFPLADRLTASGVPVVFHTARADLASLQARYPRAQIVRKPSAANEVAAALGQAVSRLGATAAAAS